MRRSAPSSRTASTRSRAARTARSASPSVATGVPHTAITASPMNFSTTPPYRRITVLAVSKYAESSSRTSSGSRASDSGVKPTRSQNRTEHSRRSATGRRLRLAGDGGGRGSRVERPAAVAAEPEPGRDRLAARRAGLGQRRSALDRRSACRRHSWSRTRHTAALARSALPDDHAEPNGQDHGRTGDRHHPVSISRAGSPAATLRRRRGSHHGETDDPDGRRRP